MPKRNKEQSAGQLAARERQKNVPPSGKKRNANKVEKGATWPKFWSDCNKRLKSDSK